MNSSAAQKFDAAHATDGSRPAAQRGIDAQTRHLSDCPVCGALDLREWLPSTFSGDLDAAARTFLAARKEVAHGRIVRCNNCRFAFTNPQFEVVDYGRIYALAPREEPSPGMRVAARSRMQRIAAIVRHYAPRGAAVLDFGAGSGALLEALDDEAALGFELGAPGECRAGRSRLLTGEFLSMAGLPPFEETSFDAIVGVDVLEHLPDPQGFVAAWARCLKPGGHLLVSVPDASNWLARLMGRKWNMILLEHLWYFTPSTLATLMRKEGLEQIAVRSLPYDASLGHVARRLGQTFLGRTPELPGSLSERTLPMPSGLMLGIYRKAN